MRNIMSARIFMCILMLLLFLILNGCTRTINFLLQLQSPVTYKVDRNKPAEAREINDAKYDDYKDLAGRSKIVGVAMSGGGARAAYFPAAILKELESRYGDGNKTFMIDDITFYSSVSGGSITNAMIGTWNGVCKKKPPDLKEPPECKKAFAFQEIRDLLKAHCANLGDLADKAVIFNGVIFPMLPTLSTDRGYSRYLSVAMDLCLYYERPENKVEQDSWIETDLFFYPFREWDKSSMKLNEMGGDTSRHYINATILDDGSRLVFSNRRYHEFGKRPERLPNIRFLEDFTSDISEYKISDAVIASASFPGLVEPVQLRYYTTGNFQTAGEVRIVDGGIFDNSGIGTLLQVIGDQVKENKEITGQEIVILLIDSDNEERIDFSELVSREKYSGASIHGLYRGLSDAADSALMIHTLNKRRLIKLALYDAKERLKIIKEKNRGKDITLKIIPISLSEAMSIYMKNTQCVRPFDITCSITCEDSEIRDKAIRCCKDPDTRYCKNSDTRYCTRYCEGPSDTKDCENPDKPSKDAITCATPGENLGCAIKNLPTDYSLSTANFWILDMAAYKILTSPYKCAIRNFKERMEIHPEDGLDDLFSIKNDSMLLGDVIIEAFQKQGGGTPALK
jgi:hypothetical protein